MFCSDSEGKQANKTEDDRGLYANDPKHDNQYSVDNVTKSKFVYFHLTQDRLLELGWGAKGRSALLRESSYHFLVWVLLSWRAGLRGRQASESRPWLVGMGLKA